MTKIHNFYVYFTWKSTYIIGMAGYRYEQGGHCPPSQMLLPPHTKLTEEIQMKIEPPSKTKINN